MDCISLQPSVYIHFPATGSEVMQVVCWSRIAYGVIFSERGQVEGEGKADCDVQPRADVPSKKLSKFILIHQSSYL